jgi:hypothetical protein
MLTPKFLCCQSGFVDHCGVCDGDGTSCPTVAIVSFPKHDAATLRKLLDHPAFFVAQSKAALADSDAGPLRQLHQIDPSLDAAVAAFTVCMCMPPSPRSCSATCTKVILSVSLLAEEVGCSSVWRPRNTSHLLSGMNEWSDRVRGLPLLC